MPIYRKAFEAAFFISLLFLYYAVLVERKSTGIGTFECLMYFWIAAFIYDEIGGIADAGMLFYQMDFWKVWNLGIIATGLAFGITSESLHPEASHINESILTDYDHRSHWLGQPECIYH